MWPLRLIYVGMKVLLESELFTEWFSTARMRALMKFWVVFKMLLKFLFSYKTPFATFDCARVVEEFLILLNFLAFARKWGSLDLFVVQLYFLLLLLLFIVWLYDYCWLRCWLVFVRFLQLGIDSWELIRTLNQTHLSLYLCFVHKFSLHRSFSRNELMGFDFNFFLHNREVLMLSYFLVDFVGVKI